MNGLLHSSPDTDWAAPLNLLQEKGREGLKGKKVLRSQRNRGNAVGSNTMAECWRATRRAASVVWFGYQCTYTDLHPPSLIPSMHAFGTTIADILPISTEAPSQDVRSFT